MLGLSVNDITFRCYLMEKVQVQIKICTMPKSTGNIATLCVTDLIERNQNILTDIDYGTTLPHIPDHQEVSVYKTRSIYFYSQIKSLWDDYLHITFLTVTLAANKQKYRTMLRSIVSLRLSKHKDRALLLIRQKYHFLK